MTLDPRLHAYRDDLADVHLRGRVTSQRFLEGVTRQIIAPVTGVHKSADANSMQLSQALYGEHVKVFDEQNGFAFVQLSHDHYVGYVKSEALGGMSTATHKTSVPSTFMYSKPDLKSAPAVAIPQGALLTIIGQESSYSALNTGAYVFTKHITSLQTNETDFVTVAEQYYSVPYLWGGKTFAGLDCSGLVQVALHACGMACPRDSDMQENDLGHTVTLENVKRGDLMFWKGHVGIMRDSEIMIHANGHHMMVADENLAEAIARIPTPVTSVKRL